MKRSASFLSLINGSLDQKIFSLLSQTHGEPESHELLSSMVSSWFMAPSSTNQTRIPPFPSNMSPIGWLRRWRKRTPSGCASVRTIKKGTFFRALSVAVFWPCERILESGGRLVRTQYTCVRNSCVHVWRSDRRRISFESSLLTRDGGTPSYEI